MRPEHEYADLGGSHLALPGRGLLIGGVPIVLARWGSPDPAIHEAVPLAPSTLVRPMNARVTPGHDES